MLKAGGLQQVAGLRPPFMGISLKPLLRKAATNA